MDLIKKTKDYAIFRKANGRYAVKDAKRRWINAEAKVEILRAEGLIGAPAARSTEDQPAEDTESEAATQDDAG